MSFDKSSNFNHRFGNDKSISLDMHGYTPRTNHTCTLFKCVNYCKRTHVHAHYIMRSTASFAIDIIL